MTENETMDPAAAATLIRQTQTHSVHALKVRTPPLYAVWGTAWLLGLGGMWLSVRDQQPYHGPSGTATATLGVLLFAAAAVTAIIVVRAAKGVGGASAMQGQIYGLSWPIGFASLFAIQGALARQDASDEVLGVLGAAGPILVTALIYLVGAAIWREWSMFYLGAWLALVAGAGAWTGPVNLLLVGAIAGGGGFLVAAVLSHRRQRS
jgi:hypothetical protein